ncbi:nucleotidyltransferase family protein [Candidatus Bipolaricaulota bacterium]|nr:nucleotidyltransferase family protein [Candidatus Bipolaricaulota bacterium]
MARGSIQRKTAEEILAILRVELPEMRQRYGVRSLGLFGSVVRREERSNSDIDILVEFARAPTFFQFVALEDDLSKLLGARVDLVMRSALKPCIGERILSEVLPV